MTENAKKTWKSIQRMYGEHQLFQADGYVSADLRELEAAGLIVSSVNGAPLQLYGRPAYMMA